MQLTRNDARFSVEQCSNFKPLNIKAKVAAGVVVSQAATHLETKSILKIGFSAQTSIALYLGLKYSIDGVAFLIGMKVGAIKMLFPILVL